MKIIGSDYDGTLNHGGIDDLKRKAIEKWRSKGNAFVLVSGRGPDDVLKIYNEMQFGCDYFIANNGALIMKTDGTVVSDIRCDGCLVVPLINLLFEKGCCRAHIQSNTLISVYTDENHLCDADEYIYGNIPDIPYFNQISTILPDYDSANYVVQCIREQFGDELNPLQNGVCIDIVNARINKAEGLRILMDILGADYDDIITVGDNINDSDMIKEFRSYAMDNGVDEIKKLADFLTSSVTELIEKELSE